MDLPRQLGPYRLVRRLGAGGMAEVFLAYAFGASGFEKPVAIKTLLPTFRGDGTFERILIEEARIGARLVHGNLVQVHDLGVSNGEYFVRMDYIDGADLAALLDDHPKVEPAIALYIVEAIATALDYLHNATDDAGRPLGLVHRDVSPSNVLLSRAGEVKLGDFGVAKATLLADITQSGARKGKYAYMSPEQIAGDAITAASDQFGLGVVLYEMLTGARPFDGASPLETMERIRAAQPPDVRVLDADVAALVSRLLARDPRSRFANADAVATAAMEARTARRAVRSRDVAAWVARHA
jgi:serine/threonine-protein kinase